MQVMVSVAEPYKRRCVWFRQVVNAIVHHAFPTRLELLFAFDYAGDTTSTG